MIAFILLLLFPFTMHAAQKYTEKEQVDTFTAFCINNPTPKQCKILAAMLPEFHTYFATCIISETQQERFALVFSYALTHLPEKRTEIAALQEILAVHATPTLDFSLPGTLHKHRRCYIQSCYFAVCCTLVFVTGIMIGHVAGKSP